MEPSSAPDLTPARPRPDLDVTLVHDYLNQRGGAERVVLELSDLWPQAPIYTSLFRPQSTHAEFAGRDVRTTFLDRLPVDAGFRNLLPLYPAAFRSLGQLDADVVIASSSGWGHLARTTPRTLHAVYCHTPARWLYGGLHLSTGTESLRERALGTLGPALRRIDRQGALRADVYIANSHGVQERIAQTYGIGSTVIYPPVDVHRFTPTPRGDRLLVISRLLPYKRVDLVIRTADQLGLGLDVVGSGPQMAELQALAGPGVQFHGGLDDRALTELMESCRAVCVMGEEDFGIVAVEAQAAGKPVVALGRGGSLESVRDGWSGAFFTADTTESVATAIRACDAIETSPADIAERVRDLFSREAFASKLTTLLAERWEMKRGA
jgi:glycosyltransferase involved in cell wall biosynthesis